MADKIPVNVKKDYRVKKPTGMAKEMREAGEGMGKMKASPRLQAKMDAVKRHRDEHEGGHTPGFPLGRRSTSDGYMPKSKDPYNEKLTKEVKKLGKGKTIIAGK